MATPLNLPLPEITVEDFHRSWVRFELVAGAKQWDTAKQNLILLTLLQSKLVDIYMSVDDTTRGHTTWSTDLAHNMEYRSGTQHGVQIWRTTWSTDLAHNMEHRSGAQHVA